jgi:hypothetical protein
MRKPRAKSVPDIFANKMQDQEQGSSDDPREGASDDILPELLEARRTLDLRFEEAVMRQRSRSQEEPERHSDDIPPHSRV